ncbi:MAG: hypothetical protein ACI8YQ_003848 [Polaribacter sp.]|jgi:hypothetical protein
MFKKTLKWLAIIVGVLIIGIVIAGLMMNESKPTGTTGPQADALANKMLIAINKPAWDSTKYVNWTFKGMHTFLWDKERHFVRVRWGANEVLLHTKSVTGKAYVNGTEVTGEDANKLVQDAWSYFCNDSFWLNAPAKAFDPGTSRGIVKNKDGSEDLMVSYESGGVTPGDSYLWILDDSGLPTAYKMWVDIIPIGGFGATWEKWENLPTGAKISTFHKLTGLSLDISDLKAGMNATAVGEDGDPFESLVK